MPSNKVSEKNPIIKIIMHELSLKPQGASELRVSVNISKSWSGIVLRHLRKQQKIYVCKWELNGLSNAKQPIYAVGNSPDAEFIKKGSNSPVKIKEPIIELAKRMDIVASFFGPIAMARGYSKLSTNSKPIVYLKD
jgi:hypothetical protein